MTRTNIVRAGAWRGDKCRTDEVWQYDHGLILKLEGMELPTAYEVHFANDLKTPAIQKIGNADGVQIPDELLKVGRTILAYVYLHTGDSDGETVKTIAIPVVPRADISDIPPTPAQQTAIEEAIEALNAAVEHVDAVSSHVDEVEGNIQDIVDAALQEAKDSGEFDGPKGDKGDTGEGVAPGGTPGQVLKKTGSENFETGWADETVRDVQVGGTSVLSNGVANVPVADANRFGVVKVGNGLAMSNNGTIGIQPAPSVYIKAGDQQYNPISPKRQHESAFYGLAKAAGDTTQSQSDNAVGRYTDAAKAAIQTMLDIPSNAGMRAAIAAVNTMDIHICTSEEYDAETGMPTIQNPDEKTFYLVPGGEGNNMFVEWAYVDNAWERFGSADVKLEVATIEETQAIITDYNNREEDEGMVFEMVFIDPEQGDPYYESVDSAEAIVAAFKSGKNVLLHYPSQFNYLCTESYATMVGYDEPFDWDGTHYDERVFVEPSDHNIGRNIRASETSVVNGKFSTLIYID